MSCNTTGKYMLDDKYIATRATLKSCVDNKLKDNGLIA